MPEILTYIDHAPNPNTICSICLEPVAQKAVKISCHQDINCSQCMGYWFEDQIDGIGRAGCPHCRKVVDASNMHAPVTSMEWKDFQDMEWEEEDDGGFFDDEDEDGQAWSDDEVGDEDEISGVTSAGDGDDNRGEVAEVEDEEIKNDGVPGKARQFPVTEEERIIS